jgi:hypothetical protein
MDAFMNAMVLSSKTIVKFLWRTPGDCSGDLLESTHCVGLGAACSAIRYEKLSTPLAQEGRANKMRNSTGRA